MDTPNDNFMHYYSFAGFFVKKLVEKFGVSDFKLFYKSINRNMDYDTINQIFTTYFDNSIITFNNELFPKR